MASLVESIKQLESDLAAQPMRIAAHSDMPFAIFRYPPQEEFALRKQLRLLAITLSQNHGRRVTFISIARIVWETIRDFGETDLFETESPWFRCRPKPPKATPNFGRFPPSGRKRTKRIAPLRPDKDIAFFVRAGGFAPYIYSTSQLLDRSHNRTLVPVVVFYPGSAEVGTDLRFFDLPIMGSPGVYNYRENLRSPIMSTIGTLFEKQIDRPIEEVIKVDQANEQAVGTEIGEYDLRIRSATSSRRFTKRSPSGPLRRGKA